ncbi:MAG: PAS domain S-box protein [Nitrospirota bacterium]|nr:PAS domain S-box protein [Nitrospirota bacterium]
MKHPKIRYEDKVVLLSLLGAIGVWIMDAAIDAWVFGVGTFIESLITEISPHELYFRLFVLLSFFLFGTVISSTLARRKRAEERLRTALANLEDEKARSEAVIAAIPDGISIQDRNYRILYQNQVHKALVGDHLGKTCYEAYSNRTSLCPECPVARSCADGRMHTLEKTRSSERGTIHIEINSAPLRNARGEIVAGIEAVRDITEHKRFEENLKLFSTAIEEAMDGVQIVDLNGHIIYSNKAVEEIYGYSSDELTGTQVDHLNVDAGFASDEILPALREKGRWSGEVLVHHKDGHDFPIWLSTSLVNNAQGTPIAMISIIRDITSRKRSEEELNRHREQLECLVDERTSELQEANQHLQFEIAERVRMEGELARIQKLESLGLLAGGIAHDFNNLLGAIMGNISMAMIDVDPGSRAYTQLTKAESASIRAQELTQQLLTFSRGGAPVKRPTSLSAVIAEAAGFSLHGSRVLHELSLPADLWAVDADEGQMMQVFSNILINADQAMPDGGIIRIVGENVNIGERDAPPLKAGRYVKVTISDEGTGIPKEHLPKIFDPYFTTKQKGSGLGLAATFSIIRRHDGHITVTSELGKGAQFSLFLPASESKAAPPSRAGKIAQGSGRVLIMDDDADMRDTTADMLTRLGYTVTAVSDGSEAIESYFAARESGAPFDAVIMDLTIPGGMGGQDTVARIRELDPEVKAIVSSGYSQDPIMADFQAYGFKGMVSKPYRIRELGEVVARVIKDSEPEA